MPDPLKYKSEEEYVVACETERDAEQKLLAGSLAADRQDRLEKDKREQHGHSFPLATRICDHCGITLRDYHFNLNDRTQRCPNEPPQEACQHDDLQSLRDYVLKRWCERRDAVIERIVSNYDAWDANAQMNAHAEQSEVAYTETMQTFLRQVLEPLRMP